MLSLLADARGDAEGPCHDRNTAVYDIDENKNADEYRHGFAMVFDVSKRIITSHFSRSDSQ